MKAEIIEDRHFADRELNASDHAAGTLVRSSVGALFVRGCWDDGLPAWILVRDTREKGDECLLVSSRVAGYPVKLKKATVERQG